MLARFRARAHTRTVPPLAIAAALSSAIIHASWNAALKGGRGDRIADAFLIAVGGILVALVLFATMGTPAAASWPFLAASVLIHLIYWALLFRAYDIADLSHIYTLSRGTAPLLVTLGAMIAAHETPPPVKAVGMVLVSIGVLCVGFSPNAPLRASLWALLLGVSIASYSLNDALGARLSGNPALYVGWTSGLMGVPMIAFCFWRRGRARLLTDARVASIRGIAIGVLSFAGYGLVLWAQTFAPIGQVTALRETSVVWGALIAFVFLREDLGLRRWLGAVIVALGAGLIAFG
ncbi:MAG: EamA family transporter [Proteobacteria bacterium]|nr:EamA family transporter [Pseudomonadota bacterium]